MPEGNELDTQLAEDLEAKGQEPTEPEGTKEPEGAEEAKEPAEPKTFDENYVKGLRAENAKYRRRARDAEAQNQRPQVNQFGQPIDPNTGMPIQSPQMGPQPYQGPQPQQQQPQGPMYDPRVDDMLLGNKLAELKQDEYLGGLFAETDDEGRTFEERLLESAVQKGIPIEELDSLAWKMEREKILGKVKQKGIDESYESMKNKGDGSAEKNVSSGKNVEGGEINSIDDAAEAAMKELGVTDITKLG